MNESDSERVASVLDDSGYEKASKISEADLIVFNLCSVRQTAVDRIYGQFCAKSKINKKQKVILTGCILEIDKKKIEDRIDLVFDIKDMEKLKDFLNKNKDWRKEFKRDTGDTQATYLKIKPKYKNKDHAFVPIMTGCDNFCSYCVVPYTRGREWSRPVDEILKEVKNLVKNGCKEIILLGQNVNSYKSETVDFAKFLYLLNDISGEFKISFITNHPKDINDDLIEAIQKCDKVVKHIHLPFQAGDNDILKKMNRKYTREDYLKLVKKIKKKIPNVKFSTDIIVGFPGETEEQFQKTVDIIKKVKFDLVYINKYSPRQGTLADKKYKDDIPWKEKKRRWGIINSLLNK